MSVFFCNLCFSNDKGRIIYIHFHALSGKLDLLIKFNNIAEVSALSCDVVLVMTANLFYDDLCFSNHEGHVI